MFISKIEIKNFRNFENSEIDFNEGTNVIIGHNNAGKSNLLKALSLIFNPESGRKLKVDDFYKKINTDSYFEQDANGDLKIKSPPKIVISAFISQSINDNSTNEIQPDDNNTIYEWRIQTSPYYIARLTYEFFLPEGDETKEYIDSITKLIDKGIKTKDSYWNLIHRKFIHKYISRIYGGIAKLKNRADSDQLRKFDFQFLDAIRDVEKELFTGKNTLLKDVLKYFLDHKITIDTNLSEEQKQENKESKHEEFATKSSEVIMQLKQRINTDPILEYSKDVGASIGGEPDFEGSIDEVELFSTLRLIVEKETGIKLPATHNGLGYNNLLFISVLLAKMQMSRSDYVSQDDKKVFPMLIIEEPEAHLHPSMQFKFLKFLKENLKTKNEVRQIFITTHSTHITSAVELDEIICLNVDDENNLQIAYPGKVFDSDKAEDKKSKAYVKRFLDATKSDMLFAKTVLLVEGVAEQLLIHCLADYENKSLEDNHVAVVNVNGRYFNHFLKLFDFDSNDTFKKHAIQRKVSCITDADPVQKDTSGKKPKFKKCFPFELNIDTAKFEYKKISEILSSLQAKYAGNSYIKISSRVDGKGKTFEYELAYNNASTDLLITDEIANIQELKDLINAIKANKPFSDILSILKNQNIQESIELSNWTEEEKKSAIIAARYLQSIENSSWAGKGEHALNLDMKLRDNLKNGNPVNFSVPEYIKEAINHVCS
ncbi:ATP-dependent nuclease [Desulfobacula toluolica]|uniref:Putative DNA replication and repair protein, relted to recF n=1 Tax=Desulfobacula toluolica (strain DSM 7467 / Tol2) TaxID=651182 RepID=K0N9T7_DESTT|nr:AAA family ATPase [Desulfobacula toluolica]CCK80744.1 putative DNA replication and repair protein, relted to recF [Desulfobacula toluolica Tol2]